MDLNSDQFDLLKTKFFKPGLTFDYIPRPSLLDRLNAIKRLPLLLISTPAGYGKPTLVSGWLEYAKVIFSWLSLGEYDDTPFTFI